MKKSAFEELSDALNSLIEDFGHTMGIYKLLNWLAERMK